MQSDQSIKPLLEPKYIPNKDTKTLTGSARAGDIKVGAVIGKPDTMTLRIVYGLSPKQVIFFTTETGINNDNDLKTHILEVQKRACQVGVVMLFLTMAETEHILSVDIPLLCVYIRFIYLQQVSPSMLVFAKS